MRAVLGILLALNAVIYALGMSGHLQRWWPSSQPEPSRSAPAQTVPTINLLDETPPAPGRPPAIAAALTPPGLVAQPPSPPAPPVSDAPVTRQPSAAPAHPPAASAPKPPGETGQAGPEAAVAQPPAAPVPADTPPPPASAPAAASRGCYRVGPLPAAETASLDALRAALTRAGVTGLRAVPLPQGRVRYWVHAGEFASAAAARTQERQLKDAGFADVLALQDGATWRVSLGLFDQRVRAEALAERARAAGFAVQIRQRPVTPPRTMLEFRATATALEAARAALAQGPAPTPCTP